MYLRQFKQLRLVNLAGNPICKDHDYRSYVLSHVKDLIYLDYRRVNQADVAAAREQHQVRPWRWQCVGGYTVSAHGKGAGKSREGTCGVFAHWANFD